MRGICASLPCRSGRAAPAAICNDQEMTLVIAHRGASRAERENTIAAFVRAVEMGADGIELDVRRTADDVLVVHHDAMLGDGRIVRQVPAGELPDHVPTLSAALDACAGAFVNVEIKNDPSEPDFDPTEWAAHRTLIELGRRGADARWLVSSFRHRDGRHLPSGSLARAVRTAWLVAPAGRRAEIERHRGRQRARRDPSRTVEHARPRRR